NIFVAVASCTWISRPITGSKRGPAPFVLGPPPGSDTRRPLTERQRLLEREARIEEPVLAERGPGDLQAYRETLAARSAGAREPARDRDRGDAGERHRHGEVVAQVHRPRIGRLLAEADGDVGRGRRHDQVDLLERRPEI